MNILEQYLLIRKEKYISFKILLLRLVVVYTVFFVLPHLLLTLLIKFISLIWLGNLHDINGGLSILFSLVLVPLSIYCSFILTAKWIIASENKVRKIILMMLLWWIYGPGAWFLMVMSAMGSDSGQVGATGIFLILAINGIPLTFMLCLTWLVFRTHIDKNYDK